MSRLRSGPLESGHRGWRHRTPGARRSASRFTARSRQVTDPTQSPAPRPGAVRLTRMPWSGPVPAGPGRFGCPATAPTHMRMGRGRGSAVARRLRRPRPPARRPTCSSVILPAVRRGIAGRRSTAAPLPKDLGCQPTWRPTSSSAWRSSSSSTTASTSSTLPLPPPRLRSLGPSSGLASAARGLIDHGDLRPQDLPPPPRYHLLPSPPFRRLQSHPPLLPPSAYSTPSRARSARRRGRSRPPPRPAASRS